MSLPLPTTCYCRRRLFQVLRRFLVLGSLAAGRVNRLEASLTSEFWVAGNGTGITIVEADIPVCPKHQRTPLGTGKNAYPTNGSSHAIRVAGVIPAPGLERSLSLRMPIELSGKKLARDTGAASLRAAEDWSL